MQAPEAIVEEPFVPRNQKNITMVRNEEFKEQIE